MFAEVPLTFWRNHEIMLHHCVCAVCVCALCVCALCVCALCVCALCVCAVCVCVSKGPEGPFPLFLTVLTLFFNPSFSASVRRVECDRAATRSQTQIRGCGVVRAASGSASSRRARKT